jgi:hypothetical protein
MAIGLDEHMFAFKQEVAISDENPRVSRAHGTKVGAKTLSCPTPQARPDVVATVTQLSQEVRWDALL